MPSLFHCIIHKTVICFYLYLFFLYLIKQEDLTPEELSNEKLKVKKLQEESDLELANDAFGKKRLF